MMHKGHIASLLFLLYVLDGCEQKNLSDSALEQRTAEIIEYYKSRMLEEGARSNLAKAVEGDPVSEWKTGNLLLMAWTYSEPSKESEEARQLGNAWLLKAAEDGCPYAMLDVAIQVNGVDELAPEKEDDLARKGAALLENKTDKDALDARYLSACYTSGIGVKQDIRIAHKWFSLFIEKERSISEGQKEHLLEEWRKKHDVPPEVVN